jgi:hypothetical protein
MARHQFSDTSGYIPTPNTRISQEEELFLEPLESDGHHSKQVHLASLSEKKRLWWQNAVINTLLILSWCVMSVLL